MGLAFKFFKQGIVVSKQFDTLINNEARFFRNRSQYKIVQAIQRGIPNLKKYLYTLFTDPSPSASR